jgi:class 3 adenylate cyclase
MSAFGGKADIPISERHVCFSDIAQRQPDHFQPPGLTGYDAIPRTGTAMRRSKAGVKPAKAQRHGRLKRRNKPSRDRHSSAADLQAQLALRTQELSQALEQQTAAADVLRVISSSSGNLQTVFDTMLAKATDLCDASYGLMWLREGDAFRAAALYGDLPQAYRDRWRSGTRYRPGPETILSRVTASGRPIQVPDLRIDPSYLVGDPLPVAAADVAGVRTLLGVPMLRDKEVIGFIGIYRKEIRPFTEKQVTLVTNFAAQAVIAIENMRLLNELRQRTGDLSEALEQQTATSDVLGVISSSPGELQAVFDIILKNANRLCDAKFSALFIYENGLIRVPSHVDLPPPLAEHFRKRNHQPPIPGTAIETLIKTKRLVHIRDQHESPEGLSSPATTLAGARTYLAVPLLKDGNVLGAIATFRQEVRPFTDKQIELVQNFASQTVIAIENARLLIELRQSLEQQTATSEVLHIISSSPGELEPVFEAILENATRLCEAKFGVLALAEGEAFRSVAIHKAPPAFVEFRRREPLIRPAPGTALGCAVATKEAAQIADVSENPAHQEDALRRSFVELTGARTLIVVPMLKDNEVMGAIIIYRQEVRLFTDKQIELLRNFASQAVIAIENARLLNDLNKLNQQLEHRVTDQVGEIERMGRLRRFLPPQVADLIVASGSEKQLESHRREITALFCDLRGFTGFSESSDPEDVMALLRDYHAAIGKIIIKYSGTLERYAGDGVMVVFNDPVPVENPALQAVLMALEMRAAIGALTETWHRWGHDIGFGIGIAHGFATLGTIGFEGRFDYAAIGTVSNVASRLCDEAKPGQILISPRVLTKVENAVTVEPVGEFTLKGIRRPMLAYNVLEHSTSKLN